MYSCVITISNGIRHDFILLKRMNRRKKMSARIRVIAVACSATFLLAACSEKPNQSNQSEPSFKENWLKKSEIDPDRRIACTDLNQYVNAKWLSNNPIPADKTQWGPFEILKEKSLNDQRAIAEAAAKISAALKPARLNNWLDYFMPQGWMKRRLNARVSIRSNRNWTRLPHYAIHRPLCAI